MAFDDGLAKHCCGTKSCDKIEIVQGCGATDNHGLTGAKNNLYFNGMSVVPTLVQSAARL